MSQLIIHFDDYGIQVGVPRHKPLFSYVWSRRFSENFFEKDIRTIFIDALQKLPFSPKECLILTPLYISSSQKRLILTALSFLGIRNAFFFPAPLASIACFSLPSLLIIHFSWSSITLIPFLYGHPDLLSEITLPFGVSLFVEKAKSLAASRNVVLSEQEVEKLLFNDTCWNPKFGALNVFESIFDLNFELSLTKSLMKLYSNISIDHKSLFGNVIVTGIGSKLCKGPKILIENLSKLSRIELNLIETDFDTTILPFHGAVIGIQKFNFININTMLNNEN
ncbi:hypothetical protein RCL1_004325 [Eukaryota sp. TZLM3-RCL]